MKTKKLFLIALGLLAFDMQLRAQEEKNLIEFQIDAAMEENSSTVGMVDAITEAQGKAGEQTQCYLQIPETKDVCGGVYRASTSSAQLNCISRPPNQIPRSRLRQNRWHDVDSHTGKRGDETRKTASSGMQKYSWTSG